MSQTLATCREAQRDAPGYWPLLTRLVQDRNRVDIVIYEEDYLTRALLQEWLGHAGYRVRVGRAHDANLKFRRIS